MKTRPNNSATRFAVRKVVFEGTHLIHYHVRDADGVVDVIRFRHGARVPKTDEL